MLREQLEQLCSLDEETFSRIAFLPEPLHSRLSSAQQWHYYDKATAEGQDCARMLLSTHSGNPQLSALLEEWGACVREVSEPPEEQYALFAYFERPNVIVLNRPTVERSQELVESEQLTDLLGTAPIREVLLCHELYHMMADRNKTAFSQQRHLPFLQVGRLQLRRKSPCLEEMAAMAFARELLGLPCSPYAFNLVMTYAFFPQQAQKILQDYLSCREEN